MTKTLTFLCSCIFMAGCGSGSNENSSKQSTKEKQTIQTSKAGMHGYSTDKGELSNYIAPALVDGTNKKLMAIYMVGSDLEENGEAGTNDFNEIIEGYNLLSESEKNSLDIVVAFGGSNKDGWRGMRISTISEIIADGEDGIYGNLAEYKHYSPKAHMGDDSSLQFFVQYLKDGYGNHQQKVLTMWDHGSAYGSFGNDSNFDGDGLTMAETDKAFTNIGLHFDVIGYDACLNGNFEIASIIKKHADYLIGSEELEPGHGWNYKSVIPSFVKNSDLKVYGTEIVNDFINHDSHPYKSDGKTLSMVDLSHYDELKSAVDALATYVDSELSVEEVKKSVITSTTNTQQYGKSARGDKAITIDLKGFSDNLAAKLAEKGKSSLTNDLNTAFSKYVVHANQDGTRPNSNGVSIAPTQGHSDYTSDVGPSASWYSMTRNMQGIKNSDTSAPTISEQELKTQVESSDFANANIQTIIDQFYTSLQSEVQVLLTGDWANITAAEQKTNLEEYWYKKEDAFWNKNNSAQAKSYYDQCTDSNNPSCQAMIIPLSTQSVKSISFRSLESNTGTRAKFHDTNLQNVKTMYGNIVTVDDTEYFATTATMKSLKTNIEDEYFTPTWDQYWYVMYYGENENDKSWVPMEFENEYRDQGEWYRSYSAEVNYSDGNKDYSTYPEGEEFDYAKLYVTVDSNGEVVLNSIRPYKIIYTSKDDETGSILFDKASHEIKVGDKITLLAEYHNMETTESEWFTESDILTITEKPTFELEKLDFEDEDGNPLDYYYMMIATDINDNWTATEPAKVK